MRENDYFAVEKLVADGSFECIEDMADDGWEQLGRDTSKNFFLRELEFVNCRLDDNKMSFLFRGLTRSSSIKRLCLRRNEFGFNGVQSMVPFLQNANNLLSLTIDYNNITSEGFNSLFRSLRDSPITLLSAHRCGVDTIEIDVDSIPNNLQTQ